MRRRQVSVGQNGLRVGAGVQIKERVPEGCMFLAGGTARATPTACSTAGPVRVQIQKLSEVPA